MVSLPPGLQQPPPPCPEHSGIGGSVQPCAVALGLGFGVGVGAGVGVATAVGVVPPVLPPPQPASPTTSATAPQDEIRNFIIDSLFLVD
jgi:hypothetical protein